MAHTDLVLERTLDAPLHLVWLAYTDPEHLKRWWAPRPYQTTECEIDLRPGGIFRTRMVGPDGFDTGTGGAGCILEVVPQGRLVWTNTLGPGFRPNSEIEDCGAFPFSAIISFADAGDGRTLYRAVAVHKDQADSDRHAQMGFHEGWGTCADQLGELARELA